MCIKKLAEGTCIARNVSDLNDTLNGALVQGGEFSCSTAHTTCERPCSSTLPLHKTDKLDQSLAAQQEQPQNVTEIKVSVCVST